MASRNNPASKPVDFDALVNNAESIQVLEPDYVFDKAELVGVPFVITGWSFDTSGKYDKVIIDIATKERSGKLHDGSTGIMQQMKRYQEQLKGIKPISVPSGLRFSEYDTQVNGRTTKAKTYYIDNA